MSSAQPLSVLVVDPDVETRGALSSFLLEEGFRPTELEDSSMAPGAVKDGRYHMVLLDLGEPEVDGVALLQKIRSLDDDLCVICMTGQPSVEAAVATMKHRAFDYLKKPLEIGELRPVLRNAIREHGLLVNVEKRLNAMVGERGRSRRHEMGLTLKQVANRTGLSVSLISQIELGKSAASVLTLHKLSTALGVKMTHFFEAI
jgi:two-component system OmpR family response regulator